MKQKQLLEEERRRRRAKSALDDIQRVHPWSYQDIIAASPEKIEFQIPYHWYCIINLFADDDVIWCGRDRYDSGAPGHAWRFRPALEWLAEKSCPGPFVCPSTFKPGVSSRSNENVLARKFLIVESDTLGHDGSGAIFRWLQSAVGLRLRAVVDTANKSLHGWFEFPPADVFAELEIWLPLLGCDPSLFKPSQPCRLPGALRDGNYQRLIYLS